ncbi:halocyanin domain-containing protein, partial [Halorubrum sp. CBA1125]|uniref:halocyanin domain-containing protein n=1 Tax=Halorubrum sp. CBA1125 TaxID=2668072 RepID=UPI0012E85480
AVGAGDVGFAFDPAAIRVDAGTTVVWEWTGEGGAHNVVSAEGSNSQFDSGQQVEEQGHTFEQTFDSAGIELYYCTPHRANGMLGAIEVVEG